MTLPVTFIHLTDLHIANPAVAEPHLYTDTSATLRTVLDHIETIDPRPDFIVVSGDIANNGDPAAYQELKRVWGDCTIPVFYALGNHDDRAAFYDVMLGRTENTDAPYCYDLVVAGIHLIVLDTSVPGLAHGDIEPEQFDWLAATLGRNADLPKLIILHHGPAIGFEQAGQGFETLSPEDSQRLARLLAGRNVLGLLSGHIHQDRFSLWHGVPVIVGNGHHSSLDVLHAGALRSTRGAGFAYCRALPEGLTVNFISLPGDGAELSRTSFAEIRAYLDGLLAARAAMA